MTEPFFLPQFSELLLNTKIYFKTSIHDTVLSHRIRVLMFSWSHPAQTESNRNFNGWTDTSSDSLQSFIKVIKNYLPKEEDKKTTRNISWIIIRRITVPSVWLIIGKRLIPVLSVRLVIEIRLMFLVFSQVISSSFVVKFTIYYEIKNGNICISNCTQLVLIISPTAILQSEKFFKRCKSLRDRHLDDDVNKILKTSFPLPV